MRNWKYKKKPKLGDSYELFSSLLLYQFEIETNLGKPTWLGGKLFQNWFSYGWPEHCPPLVCFLLLKKEHLNWWIDVTSDLGLTPRSHTRRSLTNEHKKIVVGRCIKLASANIHQLTVINRLPTWETQLVKKATVARLFVCSVHFHGFKFFMFGFFVLQSVSCLGDLYQLNWCKFKR